VNINARKLQHLSDLRKNIHNSIKLQNHFNKYGESDLQFSILLCCEKEDLVKIEQYFIDSYKPFFNCSPTAGNCLGIKHSKETREKLSKLRKGEKNNFYGRHHTEESKEKIRKNRIGKGLHSEQWKIEQSERMSGENHHQFGKKHSPERLLIDSKVQIGKKASLETKHKMSESGKKAWILRKQLNNK
jgi:group I intron endonuclease